jgi:GAF domain-containing protein
MLTRERIQELLQALNEELRLRSVTGEIVLCGGAVMCLVFKARESTKDVDAVFAPTRILREAAKKVARRLKVPEDWLNDAAKGYFLSEPPRQAVMELSNLRVWAPTADYMLAMKCVSARFDTHDRDDVVFLIGHLGLKTAAEVFEIVSRYYPKGRVPAKTRFLVEEILGA